MIRHITAFLFTAWLLGAPCLVRADEITPPLGVDWGEQESHLERRLRDAKATIVDRHYAGGRDMWTVEGLVQANLKRTVFYFRGNGLVEVEFQYENDKWTDWDYDRLLIDLRQRIEKRFGEGKLIARSKKPEGAVTQSLVGYEWNRNNASIQVIYFAAEDAINAYRTVSLHYKRLD